MVRWRDGGLLLGSGISLAAVDGPWLQALFAALYMKRAAGSRSRFAWRGVGASPDRRFEVAAMLSVSGAGVSLGMYCSLLARDHDYGANEPGMTLNSLKHR